MFRKVTWWTWEPWKYHECDASMKGTWNHFHPRENEKWICLVLSQLGWNHYLVHWYLGLFSWTVIHVRLSDNRGVVEVLFYLRFFDRFGKVLKLKEPKEPGEFVTEFQPGKGFKKLEECRRKNFPLEWNAIWPQDTLKGSCSPAFVSFEKHPRSRLFIEQSTWRGWAIESSQNSQNRNWNGTGALIKWSKTKPNGCVCFLQGVACGYKKDTKKIGFIADYWFLPSQGWYFKTSHWCKNDRSIRKKNVRNFASQMGWVMTMSVVYWDLQIPSVSLFYQRVFFSKNEGSNCWNKANRFPIVVKPYSKQKMVKLIANCCCEFHSRPFAALPQTIKPQISGVSWRMQKRLLFLHAHWCCFFCSTSCNK